jgi:hypothetical protein
MSHHVTASFGTRQEAEAARARLEAAGVAPSRIEIGESKLELETGGAGMFDKLADLLAPGQSEKPGGFLLNAEVSPELLEAATRALRPEITTPLPSPTSMLRPHTLELVLRGEELVVTKEQVVREEVVLKKKVDRRIEEVIGSDRRTEVEIERLSAPEDQGLI